VKKPHTDTHTHTLTHVCTQSWGVCPAIFNKQMISVQPRWLPQAFLSAALIHATESFFVFSTVVLRFDVETQFGKLVFIKKIHLKKNSKGKVQMKQDKRICNPFRRAQQTSFRHSSANYAQDPTKRSSRLSNDDPEPSITVLFVIAVLLHGQFSQPTNAGSSQPGLPPSRGSLRYNVSVA